MGKFFFAFRGEIDEEWVFADGSYVRAHQHASGARIGEERAIGASRGGATTKIHVVVDSHGKPIDFEITGGETHDIKVAPKLLKKLNSLSGSFIADKGYDSDLLRDLVREVRKVAVIPRRSNGQKPNSNFDSNLYKIGHLVENIFARIKHYRGVTTRFDKLARNFKSVIFIVFSLLWIKIGK